MNSNHELLAPGCFWYDLYTNYPPNVNWCEQELCGYIIEPSNTWSNIFYFILAIAIFLRCRKEGLPQYFSVATILMGGLSFLYHLSLNFFSQFLDFLGMYIFLCLICVVNISRYREQVLKKTTSFLKYYVSSVFVLSIFTVIFYFISIPYQILVLGLGGFILALEYKLMDKFTLEKYRNVLLGVSFLVVAISFSIADVTRTWCNPHNHIVQGHALWHLFSSIGLWFVFCYFRKFLGKDK